MTHGEQVAPATPDLRVTYRPQTKEFEVAPESAITSELNYPGDPALPPSEVAMPEGVEYYRTLKPHAAAQTFESLSALYLALGPGRHEADKAKQVLGVKWGHIHDAADRMQAILPPSVIKIESPKARSDRYIYFGNIALATALTGIDEIEQSTRHDYFHQKAITTPGPLASGNERALPEMRAYSLKAEQQKQRLFDYNHVVWQLGIDDLCYVQLNTPENVLLTRLLGVMQTLPLLSSGPCTAYRQVPFRLCRNQVWAAMPLSERRLVTDDPFALYDEKSLAVTASLHLVCQYLSRKIIGGYPLAKKSNNTVAFKNITLAARYCTQPPNYQAIEELCVPPSLNRNALLP